MRIATGSDDLADLAAARATTREAADHRAVVVAADRAEAIAALRALTGADTVGEGTTALLFTGQGAQRAGMGRGLSTAFPAYAKAFDEVAGAFAGLLDRPLTEILDDPAALARTEYAQPALFAVEVALYRLCESWESPPTT